MDSEVPRQPILVRLLRRGWPWLVGIGVLAFVATRIPYDAFRAALTQGPHVQLAAVACVLLVVILCTDSVATWIGLRAIAMPRPLATVLAVRGATYVLFLVNYAVGQGGFGYYLNRSGAPPLRAVGATLFLMGTNFATLLLVTTVAWELHGGDGFPVLRWTLLGGCAAFAVYLVVIAIAPRVIARRQMFAPLFEGGLRGHALAMLGRLPHTAIVVLGHWIAIRVWGVPVPFVVGVALMPVVAIVQVLPISPAGLGTTQAAFVYFFSAYAPGATDELRGANILAFGTVYMVYGMLASIVVGLTCTPFARRLDRRDHTNAPAGVVDERGGR
ncbi:MAG TPA: hypothetical protein VFQ53_37985 [Kofleriaceae bacterium]|nr:hypothetical protein [Kofleriaceae bacterium]